MPKRRANTEELDIPNMKVGDLKKELLSRGLDTSGKKADLVTRLEAAVQGISKGGLGEGLCLGSLVCLF